MSLLSIITLIQYRESIMTIGRELLWSPNTSGSQRSNIIDQVSVNLDSLASQRAQIIEEITSNSNALEIANTVNSTAITPVQAGTLTFIGMGIGLYLLQKGQIKQLLKLLSKR